MVTVVGGKLTTYRRMAQDTVDHIAGREGNGRPSRPTERLALVGCEEWHQAREEMRSAGPKLGLEPATLRHLSLYGSRSRVILGLIRERPELAASIVPGLPYVMAETLYSCRYEMAVALADLLERRLRISLEDRAHGVEAAPRVAALMAEELGWDAAETARQVERYRAQVAESFGGR
jgi:glycerol-3-phosphate dehydrogenase